MLLTENDTEMYIQFSPLMANEGSDAMCDVCIYFRVLFFLSNFLYSDGFGNSKKYVAGCLGHNRLEDI